MAFSSGIADFRSDTVTQPTNELRQAMAAAEVGDDVYGEDPEVNRLQDDAAAIVGMEAALFVTSGTMANQLAVNLHSRQGDEILVARGAHVRQWEASAAQANSGVAVRELTAPEGVVDLEELTGYLTQPANDHIGTYRLLSLENTFNGYLVPLSHMAEATSIASANGAAVHLDGARLFNASIAAGVEPHEVVSGAQTVSFCFSKGLGAPVGSVICGAHDAIYEARRVRKRLGGGMRQAGVLAAAARVALSGWRRLEQDHALAAGLGSSLRAMFGEQAVERIDSNMVLLDESTLPFPVGSLIEALSQEGILTGLLANGVMRIVCHQDVDQADVDRLLAVVRRHAHATA